MEVVKVAEVGIESAAARAAAVLRAGGLAVYPTDTLYGVAVAITSPEAIARLKQLKGREDGKPISVVVADIEMMNAYAYVSNHARALAAKFLPGALTLVLPARDVVPAILTKNGTIAVRIPDDSFALALARELGAPYTATSANVSGEETKSTVEEILAQFAERAAFIDLVVDDGPRAVGVPSTIVSCVGDTLEVIRAGAIPSSELFA